MEEFSFWGASMVMLLNQPRGKETTR